MNKQELIENIKGHGCWCVETHTGTEDRYIKISKVRELIDRLNEPSPVEVHKLVAEWIEQCKRHATLSECLNGHYDTSEDWEERCDCFVSTWLDEDDNDLLLARAWLDGYTVAKEPLYYVVLPYVGFLTGNYDYPTTRDKKGAAKSTEKEIKSLSDDYWAFAVPVEGEE